MSTPQSLRGVRGEPSFPLPWSVLAQVPGKLPSGGELSLAREGGMGWEECSWQESLGWQGAGGSGGFVGMKGSLQGGE